MIKLNTLLLWIFIIALFSISLPTCCNPWKKTEEFYLTEFPYKKYCSNCGYKGNEECRLCTNCGICVTPSGYEECVLGDSLGPYFREDCTYWKYGRSFYPYYAILPVIKQYSKYPIPRRHRTNWKWWDRRKPSRYSPKDNFTYGEEMFRRGWKANP